MTRDDFIALFLEGPTNRDVDWVKTGKHFRTLLMPPKIDDDAKLFADMLIETIPEKLEIALKAQSELREMRKKRIMLIKEFVREEDQYFYLELELHIFSEYFYISRWIAYWLELWNIIHDIPTPLPKTTNYASDEEIQLAKAVLIQEVFQGKLKKTGKNYCGLCPFHQEKHPSFFIFPNNHWRCFGACGEGGDSINFVMKVKNIGFLEAVRELAYGHN
jgi:hypothetical protein